jgi:hypothetical protein
MPTLTEKQNISKHTERGIIMANFVFYGVVFVPVINLIVDFLFHGDNWASIAFNTMVVLFFFFTAIVTVYNTFKFYDFYRTHFNSNAQYRFFDILIIYIIPFLDLFRLPKLFTEVIEGSYNNRLNREGLIVRNLIVVGYLFTALYFVARYYNNEIALLAVSILSIVFGFYSGGVYTQIIKNIFIRQNEKALFIEQMRVLIKQKKVEK